MNVLVDIILDSGTLRKSLQDFYYIANRISEDSRKRISEDGKYRTTEDSFYMGDIIDDFQVTENFPDIFYGVQQTDPVTLLLANGNNGIDDTWDEIIAAEEIRGKRVLIRREDLSIIGSGKIIDYIIGDEVSLSIELRNDEIFDTLLPRQLVTAAEFTTTALNIGTPVPILPGYCKNVPLANIQNNLVDDHYDYLVGYGTIESLWIDHNNNRGVKRNGVLVAESEYTFYDGSQASPYPGYSFIRFVKEQMDFSGGFYMLSADVKGLELSGASADKNFANVIKALIEDTTWGLGDLVNSASFAAAATALSTTYWMCDGPITKQVKARDILDQLLFSARSSLKRNSDGEWEITVDGTQSSLVSFGENDGYYDNCEIESVGITPSISAIKKAIVHYDMKETPYRAGDIIFSNSEQQAIIGQKEITLDVNTMFGADQTFELPFVIEDVTAKKILSYIYGRAKYADKKVTFKADSDAKDLYCGNVITITSTLRNLSVVEHKVISISKRLTEYLLECERYDSRIFDDQSITDPTAWSGTPAVEGLRSFKGTVYNATGTILFTVNPDGSGSIGQTAQISWDIDGVVTIPGSLITGKISTADENTYFDLTNKKLVFNAKDTFASVTAGIFMGLDDGVYKLNIGDEDLYLKIFEGNAEFSGYLYAKYKIPSGLIIPFNSVSVPSGWERFTAMDGKHLIGAGSTYAVADSGGTSPLAISKGSTTNGAHTGTGITMVLDGGPDALYYSSKGAGLDGNHLHTLTADYDRIYQQLLLIKATEGHQSYPANAVVLSKESTTPLAGVSICCNANKLLRSGASIANGGGLANEACSSDGNHVHNEGTLQTAGAHNLPRNKINGSHSHSISEFSISDEELKRAYLTAWTKTSGFEGASGMIAMWEGSEAPEGWHLCDGSDGYIDLRDYFIILSDTGNAGDTHDEANRVEVTITLTQSSWSHQHNGANAPDDYAAGVSGSHQNENQAHNHTIATAWINYRPAYYALTFIQKI